MTLTCLSASSHSKLHSSWILMVRGTDPGSLFIRNQPETSFIFHNDATLSVLRSLGAAEWLHAYFKGTLTGAASISVCVLRAALSDHAGLLGDRSIISASIIENLKRCVWLQWKQFVPSEAVKFSDALMLSLPLIIFSYRDTRLHRPRLAGFFFKKKPG